MQVGRCCFIYFHAFFSSSSTGEGEESDLLSRARLPSRHDAHPHPAGWTCLVRRCVLEAGNHCACRLIRTCTRIDIHCFLKSSGTKINHMQLSILHYTVRIPASSGGAAFRCSAFSKNTSMSGWNGGVAPKQCRHRTTPTALQLINKHMRRPTNECFFFFSPLRIIKINRREKLRCTAQPFWLLDLLHLDHHHLHPPTRRP